MVDTGTGQRTQLGLRLRVALAQDPEDAVQFSQINPGGGGTIIGSVWVVMEVADINAPSELSAYNGKTAAMIVVTQRTGSTDLSSTYIFDPNNSDAANGRTIVTALAHADYTAPKWVAGASYNLLGEIIQEGNHRPMVDNLYDLGQIAGTNLRWKNLFAMTVNAATAITTAGTLAVTGVSSLGPTATGALNSTTITGAGALNITGAGTISGVITFAGNPRAKGALTTTQSIADATTSIVIFPQVLDIGAIYNPANGEFTLPIGAYDVHAAVHFDTNATGQRNIGIFLDGTEVLHGINSTPAAGAGTMVYVGGAVEVTSAGQILTIRVNQNSTGALNIGLPVGNVANNNYVTVTKVD